MNEIIKELYNIEERAPQLLNEMQLFHLTFLKKYIYICNKHMYCIMAYKYRIDY